MGRVNGWEDVQERLALELARSVRRELYLPYVECLKRLRAPSAKLVYLYLALFQPQSFSGLRRGLGLHENTVLKALRGLQEDGLAVRDGEFLWWVAEVKES